MPISRYIAIPVGEVPIRVSVLAHAPVEPAETDMAMGGEWTQAKFLGKRKRVAVMLLGRLRLAAACRDVTQQAQRARLAAALPPFTGQRECPPGGCKRVVVPPGKRIRFAQRHQQERQCEAMPHGLEAAQRLLHQPQAFFGTSEQGKSLAKDARVSSDIQRLIPLTRNHQSAFEQGDGLPEFAFADVEIRQVPVGHALAVRVFEGFGEVDALLAEADALFEPALVVGNPGQVGKRADRRISGQAKALLLPSGQLQDPQEERLAAAMVRHREIRDPEKQRSGNLQRAVPQGLDHRLGFLAECHRFDRTAGQVEHLAHVHIELPQSARVVQRPDLGLGIAKAGQDSLELPQGYERVLQREPQIDAALKQLAPRRAVPQRRQSLIKEIGRLAVGRALRGLDAGLMQVVRSGLPPLTAHRMVGQCLDVFGQSVRIGLFDGAEDSRVQRTAPILWHGVVG